MFEEEDGDTRQTLSEIVKAEQASQELNEMLHRLNAEMLCHKYRCLIDGGLSPDQAFMYILHKGTDLL